MPSLLSSTLHWLLQSSLKGPTAELFRTFQGVIVPERPAVHCSTRSRRQQCHPNQVQLTRRVGRRQSHRFSSTIERTMQADLCCSRALQAVLQGAPLDCSNRTHCSAACLWLRSATTASQMDHTDQTKPPDIRLTKKVTKQTKTNSDSKPLRGERQRKRN